MKYALIKDGVVENVTLCEPDNLCEDCTEESCLKWHPPEGYTAVQTNVASIGDLYDGTLKCSECDGAVTEVDGKRSHTCPEELL